MLIGKFQIKSTSPPVVPQESLQLCVLLGSDLAIELGVDK
jgi:hypothetical protein